MIILGIETSCDETALALLEVQDDTYRVIDSVIHSQADLHKEFGGVFPMLAKREHEKKLPLLYKALLEKNPVTIDRVAVTFGPGLEPALWTGITFAQSLGFPIVPVNHMEGHIFGSLIDQKNHKLLPVEFPALCLLISGGHTELVLMEKYGTYKILGKTRDDAVGEAYDKVARMLGISYPGGPEISKRAQSQRDQHVTSDIALPRPMIYSKDLDFSFAGLKTSVLYALKERNEIVGLEREFEEAVKDVLVSKTREAIEQYGPHSLIIGGGVSANKYILDNLKTLGIPTHTPGKHLSGDNAVMIALAGAFGEIKTEIKAEGNLSL
jgi:N6-L-threonylcarbamoyladenine synthase